MFRVSVGRLVCFIWAIAMPAAAFAQAQAANGNIEGTVRDATGAVVPGVTVTVLNGIERNDGRLGRVVDLDLRSSRFVPFSDLQRLELFFEAKNLFNMQNVSAVTRDVTTDASGVLTAPLPSPFPPQSAYDQRQMQLSVKFSF
jgi:hypothetical protein